jgi:hypothetical protein
VISLKSKISASNAIKIHPSTSPRPHGRQSRAARAARGAIPEPGESASLLARESDSEAPSWLAKRSPAFLSLSAFISVHQWFNPLSTFQIFRFQLLSV